MNAGTQPVTHSASARASAPAPKLLRVVGSDFEECTVAAEADDDTLACERCENEEAEPELGLAGKRSGGGGRRSEAREEGWEWQEDWREDEEEGLIGRLRPGADNDGPGGMHAGARARSFGRVAAAAAAASGGASLLSVAERAPRGGRAASAQPGFV